MVKDDDHFMPSSGQSMSVGSFLVPTGMTLVLSKLQAKPDMLWKFWMYFVANCRLLAVRSMKRVVSSAKASALASLRA